MKRAAGAVGVALIVIAAVAVWRSSRPEPGPPAPPAGAADAPNRAPVPSPAAPAPVPPAPAGQPPGAATAVARRAATIALSEPALMATIRDVVVTAPERSLELAREGQRRFPNSADAAERDWIAIKSLVNLRRFHEARDEARAMLRKYPDHPLAQDVERHLLVYPLDQPSREEMQQRDRDR
jgi:hypothetical protein